MTKYTTDKYNVDVHAYDGQFKYVAYFKWLSTDRSFNLFASTKWGIKHEIRKQIKRCEWADKHGRDPL